MKRKQASCCKKCKYCYADCYCPIKDDYVDTERIGSCAEFFPAAESENENRGYSIVEFNESGHEVYSFDQRL